MLDEHLVYSSDAVRLNAYRQAIHATIREGDRVVDLGCGTGILGLLCLQAGASHIVAIDESPMLGIARRALALAFPPDRLTFIAANSHRAVVEPLVDLVVCDHVGFFGFDYGIVPTLQDARHRLLVPGGRVIPSVIRLEIAAVESESSAARFDHWAATPVPPELSWVRHHAVNTKFEVDLKPNELISVPAPLGAINLLIDQPGFVRWEVILTATRVGSVCALGGWFDCELAPGVTMTNSPLAAARLNRSQALLPIDEAVAVEEGDPIAVTVMARTSESLIAWSVEFPRQQRRFSQSTWKGLPLSSSDLMRERADRIPQITKSGAARQTVLGYCDGRRTAREIEAEVLRAHPELMPSAEETANFVAQVLARDTE